MSAREPANPSSIPLHPRNLGERLRYLRKRFGFTQVELCTALGCEQSLISNWEVGRVKPTALALAALARHYRVTGSALETGEAFQMEADHAWETFQAQLAGEASAAPSRPQVELPPIPPGTLSWMDETIGGPETREVADAMALLLQALKRGRRVWVVVK